MEHYWREVVRPAEQAHGLESTAATDPRWFDDADVELFDRTEAAMARLLTDDSPENRARAFCHYHLIVEGVLAQTGYDGLTQVYSGEHADVPELPGLVRGLAKIRQDEGRHVGFGMASLQALVHEAGVDPGLVASVTDHLLPLVAETVRPTDDPPAGEPVLDPDSLSSYAPEKYEERLARITDRDRTIPAVEDLTTLES